MYSVIDDQYRLLRVEGTNNLVTFQYDQNGSTVQQLGSLGGSLATPPSAGFTYDARGRLIQANGTQYRINALGQRIEKQGTGSDTPSGSRQFVYDEQGHLIGEYDPVSGNVMIEHIWLN